MLFGAKALIGPRFCAMGLTLASLAFGSPVLGMTVTVGKTIEITSSKRYCWFPTVHRFSTGEILVTMRMSPDEVHPEGEFSAYCVSRDEGQTWSQRYTMGAGANVDAAYTQVSPPDGTLLSLGAGYSSLIEYPPGQTKEFHVAVTKFSRGGMEFTQVRDAVLRLRTPAQLMPTMLFDLGTKDTSALKEAPDVTPWGAIIDGANGDLLTTTYYTRVKNGHKKLVLVRSKDQGKSWDEYGTISEVGADAKYWSWMGEDGPDEAALVRLSDQRIYALFRTGGDALMGQSWSSDDGNTWTPPVPTDFKGVAPHLRKLASGVLVCTTGRPGPVTLRFNEDGQGGNWSHPTEVFRGKSSCYSDVVEMEPGKLLVVYDNVPYVPNPIPGSDKTSKNTILATFIEVR